MEQEQAEDPTLTGEAEYPDVHSVPPDDFDGSDGSMSEADRIRRAGEARVREIEAEQARKLEEERLKYERDRQRNEDMLARMDAELARAQRAVDEALYGTSFDSAEAAATHDALMALPPPAGTAEPRGGPMNAGDFRRSENVIDRRGYRGMKDRALLAIQQRADEVTVAAAEREGAPHDPVVLRRDARRRQQESGRDVQDREDAVDRQLEELQKRLDEILTRRPPAP